MLTKLKLGNFKSWREMEIDLAPITLLFGTNSSGKTSILHALLLLKQTANSFDRGLHINFGGSDRDYVDFGSYRDLVYGHDETNDLRLGMNWIHYDFERILALNHGDSIGYFVKWVREEDSVIIDQLWYESHQSILNALRHKLMGGKDYLRSRRVGKQIYELETPYLTMLKEYAKTQNTDYLDAIKDELNLIPSIVDAIKIATNQFGEAWIEAIITQSSLKELAKQLNISRNTLKALQDRITSLMLADEPLSCFVVGQNLTYYAANRWYALKFQELMEKINYLGPLRDRPIRTYLWTGSSPEIITPTGKNTMELLIASKRGDKSLFSAVAGWLKKFSLVNDFELESIDQDKRYYITQLKIVSDDIGASLLDVGFGVSQVLPVITLLFFVPEGSIVLIEQPELHLHPSAQAQLADLFLEVAEKRKLQLIVESHSEHLLTRMQRRIAERSSPFATPENIKAYFCRPSANGSVIESVNVDEYGQIQNYPENFFGDLSGDLDALTDAALERRRQEINGD